MSGREEVFQQAMNNGHSAAWDQSWERAAEHYRQALKIIPDHPKALNSLGLALYEMGQYRESLQFYVQAAAATPEDPLPLEKVAELSEKIGDLEHVPGISLRAAELYLKRRDPDKAITNLTRVVRVNPGHIPAHTRLALIHERMGRKAQAVTEYIALASLMQHAGDMEKAVQAVNRALQLDANSQEARRALSMLRDSKPLPKPLRSQGLAQQAGSERVDWLPAPKESSQPRPVLDPVAEAKQNALSVLAGMLFEAPSEEAGRRPVEPRGFQAIVRGTSEALFSKQADETKIMLHVSQAVDLQTQGDNVQAAAELEHAIDAGLEHPAAYFDLGLLRLEGDRLESAQRHLQQAIKHNDFALGGRLLLAQTMRKLDRIDEATTHYLEALKLADAQVVPEDQADELMQIYEPLIEAESRQEDLQAKERLCDNISGLLLRSDWREHLMQARQDLPAEVDGGPPKPLGELLTEARSSQIVQSIAMVHKLARAGYLRSAMEEAFYALQHAPTYLPLHVYVGDLLMQQDHLAEAIDKYSLVAQVYSARGESSRAIDLLQRVIRLAPMDLEARDRLIEQLLAGDMVHEAIQEYLSLADVYYNLADLNRARETYTEAIRLAQQAKADRGILVQILHQIADIDLQSLDWRQAVRVYQQICKLRPNDQKARSRLVELNFRLSQPAQATKELQDYLAFLRNTDQGDQAIPFLESFLEENPEQTLVKRRLADLYAQNGRTEDAVHLLDGVGEKLIKLGDRQRAAEVIESIIALNPPNKEEYQRLLARVLGRQSGSLK
ncbi:MAG: tetratricopeptide repeat protein [Anaerolineales bacterium]